MHEQPPATEREQELAQEDRQQDEDEMQGMRHDDPDEQRRQTEE
jgi:hypothetical protein